MKIISNCIYLQHKQKIAMKTIEELKTQLEEIIADVKSARLDEPDRVKRTRIERKGTDRIMKLQGLIFYLEQMEGKNPERYLRDKELELAAKIAKIDTSLSRADNLPPKAASEEKARIKSVTNYTDLVETLERVRYLLS